MGRKLKKYPRLMLTAALAVLNTLVVAGMTACAYASFFKPQEFPRLSILGLAFPIFLALTLAFAVFWLFVKRRLTLISLGGLLLCSGSVRTYCPLNWPTRAPQGSVSILTYNIFNLHTDDGDKDFVHHPIVNYILRSDADIVCCQEVSNFKETQVDSLFSTHYPFRTYTEKNGAKLLVMSKFPILSTDTIHYESKTNTSTACRLLIQNDTLLLINNHLESYHLKDSDKAEYKELIKTPDEAHVRHNLRELAGKLIQATRARGPQADSVARYVERAPERHIIVCGDFNDASISYVHHRLTRTLNDAFTRSGNGPGISYHRSGMYFRIDNILCSPGVRPYECRIDRSIDASDHYPMSCKFVLR